MWPACAAARWTSQMSALCVPPGNALKRKSYKMSLHERRGEPGSPSVAQEALQGAIRGMFSGLVLGIIWGCWEEKKFVLRNCLKDYHLRENPIRLFSVMRRSVTTAPVLATFIGVHSGLKRWWHLRQQEEEQDRQQQAAQQQQQQQQQEGWALSAEQPGSMIPVHHPVLAGAAGTAAGAVRTLLCEAAAAMHPLAHAQRTVTAGLAAAGLFAVGGYFEQEQQRQQVQQQQQQAGSMHQQQQHQGCCHRQPGLA